MCAQLWKLFSTAPFIAELSGKEVSQLELASGSRRAQDSPTFGTASAASSGLRLVAHSDAS